jgi:hypothetical protein
MKLITSLISMLLLIASSAFVLQHNASQQRATKLQLNLKPTGKSSCLVYYNPPHFVLLLYPNALSPDSAILSFQTNLILEESDDIAEP